MGQSAEQDVAQFSAAYQQLKSEIRKVIVGHEAVIDGVLACLFAGGHCLLEGVPGLGKTLLVRTLSRTIDLSFSRIQCTPDLMPSDVVGTSVIVEREGRKTFEFQEGPVFAHIVLADEVNRATPKTQSALLEAMQEGHVTAGGKTRPLPDPFIVLATQNPIEMEGTYPLPEAQLDRFMMKLLVGHSDLEQLKAILQRTTTASEPQAAKVMDGAAIGRGRALVRQVIVAPHVEEYAARLVLATVPDSGEGAEAARKCIRYGSSPRGAQALILAAKVRALTEGRFNVSFEDIQAWALPALRHRLILNFEAQAEGMTADALLDDIIDGVTPKKRG